MAINRISSLMIVLGFSTAIACTAALAADMTPNADDGARGRSQSRSASERRVRTAAARPARMTAPEPASKPAGSCGTYMYWKAGACVDARSAPAKK